MNQDEQQIRQVMEDWHRASARGELDPILELMTEDATFLRCGAPPMSKAEFAAGFRQWAGRARIESTFEIRDIHASGDTAYVWSFISLVMTSDDNPQPVNREGHVLTVFRKSGEGRWQLTRDANLIPPPKPA